MKMMKSFVATAFAVAVAAMAGCSSNVEDTQENVDPSVVDVAQDNGEDIDAKYSVEGGSCTTPYGGFKGHITGYYGCSKSPPPPYHGPTCFGAAPTGAECANWCKNTCKYTGTPTLATFFANNVNQWRCGCR